MSAAGSSAAVALPSRRPRPAGLRDPEEPVTPLECVANVSEGRDRRTLGALAEACGDALIDLHADAEHHRSVFTLAGPAGAVQDAVRALARHAVGVLDLTRHDGAHPRFGVVDVVPFVPLPVVPPEVVDLAGAVAARDGFASWAAETLGIPCFLYGPLGGGSARSLPDVRRRAFTSLRPDTGPPAPHPTAGAIAVGARPALVAYNLWLEGADLGIARALAASLRAPAVRALGFELTTGVQVSCNLLDPLVHGPEEVYDRVAELLRSAAPDGSPGGVVRRAELVGLVPAAVIERVPPDRWLELDLSPEKTIEGRLEQHTPAVR